MVMPFSPNTQAATSSGNRWITNPRHLPLVAVPSALAHAKLSSITSGNLNTAGTYTALALRGAQTSITVADTYATVVDINGAGFLVNVVAPTHSASFTPTIRLTIDGTVYTIAPSAAFGTAALRMILGAYTTGFNAIAGAFNPTNNDMVHPNSTNDGGFELAATGGVPIVNSGLIALVTPEAALASGMPVLRFESALKVEVKCSSLSATAVHKQAAAIYRVDV